MIEDMRMAEKATFPEKDRAARTSIDHKTKQTNFIIVQRLSCIIV